MAIEALKEREILSELAAKYEQYIYIQPEENGADLLFGIKRFIDDYNYHRRYQGINCTVPSKLYIRKGAWS